MTNQLSSKHIKYLETKIDERYQDAAARIYKQQKRQEAALNPGDVKLGPYLVVANAQKQSETATKLVESTVCAIL